METKIIFINGRFLSQKITGVQRYAIQLVKALDSLLDNNIINRNKYEFKILLPNNVKSNINLKCINITKIGYLKGHAWEQIELPLYTAGNLLINLCNTGPIMKENQITCIHDAAVFANPKNFSFAFRTWYKILFRTISKKAKKITTVSKFSKDELRRYLNVSPERIIVIYEGKEQIINLEPNYDIITNNNLKEKAYILAVSSINPNKNFISIVKALNLLNNIDFKIVIAGSTNSNVFNKYEITKSENVKYLGYIDDSELKALYENAACFVFPSFYEGFGLPPLEAMACGCPVIVSNVASLPEVCGDAALYCDPYSPEDIADKIKMLIENPSLQEELRQKGLERAKLFTWEKCAEETMAVIEEVLNQ